MFTNSNSYLQTDALNQRLDRAENQIHADKDLKQNMAHQLASIDRLAVDSLPLRRRDDMTGSSLEFSQLTRSGTVRLRNFTVLLPTGFWYCPNSNRVTLSWCSTAPCLIWNVQSAFNGWTNFSMMDSSPSIIDIARPADSTVERHFSDGWVLMT